MQYIAVSDNRAFVSSEGKTITARLLAFDEGDVAQAKRPLTLIKDGRIRLLVSGKEKASVVPPVPIASSRSGFVKAVDEANRASAANPAPDSAKTSKANKNG